MATDSLAHRIKRIYAAIDALQELDLSKLPARMVRGPRVIGIMQDFSGGLSPEDMANIAHTAIHNIANLQDHLRRWAAHNGRDKSRVDVAFNSSQPLKIIKDLSNNDKHGYPPRGRGHSGVAPRALDIRRVMRLTTGAEAGSRVVMTLGRVGVPKVSATKGGGARGIVTGEVVDKDGNAIGDLYDIEAKAVEAWEELLRDLGLDLASDVAT